jgi:two-component system nitrate/nitrite response regulator NarL
MILRRGNFTRGRLVRDDARDVRKGKDEDTVSAPQRHGQQFDAGRLAAKQDMPRKTAAISSLPIDDMPLRLVIISPVRFIRESLAETLPHFGNLLIAGVFADYFDALPLLQGLQTHLVLIDEALPGGAAAISRLRRAVPQTTIVMISVSESAEEVIAWAEAGAAGYIPKTASLADVPMILVDIVHGKQACSPIVAGSLLRRISQSTELLEIGGRGLTSPCLTARESEIVEMIKVGMSNKEIARRLNIGVATAKTHVHHILEKMKVQRRGQVNMISRHGEVWSHTTFR